MTSVWKVALLRLLVTTCTSAEEPTGKVVGYVSSLIRYLSEEEPGSFDCWFYENSKQPSMDTILNAIVSSHRLSLIPRRVLYSEGKVEVQRSPGALIIVVNGNQFMEMALFLTSSFDRGLKIVVLHNNNNLEGFIYIVEALRLMQLHNVVYIFTDFLVIQNMEAFQKVSHIRTGAVPFHEVFIDPTSNLTGPYEAKMSAFMTDFPYAPDPRTLDDLLVTGITVEQTGDNFLKATIEHAPRIKKLFSKIEFNEWRQGDWNSQNHAYVGSRSHFYSCLNDPHNFDPETGRRRMVVLDQFTLGMRVGFFFTSYRNPLVPKLQRAEFQFFEGGFTHFWLQQITRQQYGARHVGIVAKG
ncbi:conserved hypothetical protein [Culex quinquefasciatus]|uniref:Ionotropic glutamate receptor L-glutamate and glycine-binding domain-containing protein n=1 Tax=Culex quinquefasciatus TaxID=7176 RepID=B0WAX3_CULQU|nr:conserved hypothetical protein [Culex quinquefasciatus]|eukprot:XP_001845857.1 conserved hypothetical protein [Culex quinquefasciatus]